MEVQRFALTKLDSLQLRLYVKQRVARRLQPRRTEPAEPFDRRNLPQPVQHVMAAAEEAVDRDVPRPYEGPVGYWRALDNEISIPLFKTLKRISARKLTLRGVPGSHLGICSCRPMSKP